MIFWNEKQNSEFNAKHHFTQHGKCGRRRRFSHCLQKDKTRFIDARHDNHAQINPERFHGKLGIITAFVCGAKNGNELFRKNFNQNKGERAHKRLRNQ